MKILLAFTLFIIVSLSISAQYDNEIADCYDDGGISTAKNRFFIDLTYLMKPAYVFGYERSFGSSLLLSGGLIMLNSHAMYSFDYAFSDLDELTFSSKQSTTFFLEVCYNYGGYDEDGTIFGNGIMNFDYNRVGLGYHFMQYDRANVHAFYITKSLIEIVIKNRVFLSLDAHMGMKRVKVYNYPYSNFSPLIDNNPNQVYSTLFFHLPLRAGFKF